MGRTSTAIGAVSAVNIKLPEFWPADPMIWFAQAEAQFENRSIRSQVTRFNYVVAAFRPKIATEVCDLILKRPDQKPYDKLKTK